MPDNGFLQKWQLAAEHVLSVLAAEDTVHESSQRYERAFYEMGLLTMHMPPGQHRAMLQAINTLRESDKPVQLSTILTHCAGQLQQDWLALTIAKYDVSIDGAVFDTNIRTVIEMGETARVQRSINQASVDLAQNGKRDEVINKLMSDLTFTGTDTITGETAEEGGKAFAAMMETAPDKLMQTKIAALDGWMGGIGEDDVIGIVAPYKMRKSTLKRNIALNLAEQGASIDVMMFESNATMVKAQFISMLAIRWLIKEGYYTAVDEHGYPLAWISGKDLVRVRNGYKKWHKIKVAAVSEGIAQFIKLGDRLRIFDKSRQGGSLSDLSSIRRMVMRSKNKYGTDLVCIDHMLLIDEPGTDYEVMSASARYLETLARQEKISMLLLAQMNEASIKENGNGHSPGVKGGGDLAASVDYMFTVSYKEPEEGQTNKKNDIMTVSMRLSRYGDGGAHVKSDLRIDPTSGLILGVA